MVLTDDFDFDGESGFAGAVFQQDAVRPGVGSFDAVQRQRRAVVHRLRGRPRPIRQLLSVPLPRHGRLRRSGERHLDDGGLAGV